MLLIIICYKYENACSKCFRLRQKNINVFVRTQKDESGCKRICVFPPLLINFVVALVCLALVCFCLAAMDSSNSWQEQLA